MRDKTSVLDGFVNLLLLPAKILEVHRLSIMADWILAIISVVVVAQ